MTGGLETVAGGSPETMTHDEKAFATEDELSPEERAVQGVELSPETDPDDEAAEEAAVVEAGSAHGATPDNH